MTATTHMLEIYDPNHYDGPNPVTVVGVGTVWGPENRQYYVLEPRAPVRVEGEEITQLAVSPHYSGDEIRRATEGVCTVGIALARSGRHFTPGESYGFADFCFWKVGKIHPANNH